jgi:hypothetical protein
MTRAVEAYDKYMELQERIDKIEKGAVAEFGSEDLATYQLSTASRYSLYRRLCRDRNVRMGVAQLNASMAQL